MSECLLREAAALVLRGDRRSRDEQGPVKWSGPLVIYAWDDCGSPKVAFCIFKGEQTKTAGSMGKTHTMACPEVYIMQTLYHE